MSQVVFIASSKEAREKGIAEKVARSLSERGLVPLRWWQSVRQGSFTLDALKAISENVDAAVIVWDADDSTWYRGTSVATARDNCLLESGLFLSQLGRYRTAIFARKGLKVPSDVSGLSFPDYDDTDVDTPAATLSTVLKGYLRPSSPEIVSIYIDEEIQQRTLRALQIPPEWSSKSLYFTDSGASLWLQLAKDPKYLLTGFSDELGIQRLYREAVRVVPPSVDRVVSFGPGDARNERQLLMDMLARDVFVEWVPVDISHGLLNLSVQKLKKEVAIPLGIVGDCEDGMRFVFEHIRPNSTDGDAVPRQPLVVTMLGGTFTNLDGTEQNFLNNLRGRLLSGDYFLFDASVKGADWSLGADSRSNTADYSPAFRSFVASGLAYSLGISDDDVLEKFDDRITAVHATNQSDISSVDAVSIVDKDSQHSILRFRRYAFDEFKQWLIAQSGFKVLYSDTTPAQAPDVIRTGVFVLQKE